MIPLTLALSLQGRGDYCWFPLEGIIVWFLPLEGRLRRLVRTQADSPRRGEGWERVKCQYYFEIGVS
jgi:hypothetical protein